MIDRQAFLDSLPPLREIIQSESDLIDSICQKSFSLNPWFIPDFTKQAMKAIADEFLDQDRCKSWMESYTAPKEKKRIGIIMAGNVPLVGFHDLLCVLACGHDALIKLSEKDPVLMPFIMDQWIKVYPELKESIRYADRMEAFDGVIATGSNNSARYFEYYFRDYPHILRQNRNGVAILTGKESLENLKQLAKDIFLFFGLGCRNVSKIYVPEGYDFHMWEEAMGDWRFMSDHTKYRNNLDYNYAIYIINNVPHINLGYLILKEDDAIASRIGCVHYSYYRDRHSLEAALQAHKNEIQCIVSVEPIHGWDFIPFGRSQVPKLNQYADDVDTMKFLTTL